jgi:hypothetical protein
VAVRPHLRPRLRPLQEGCRIPVLHLLPVPHHRYQVQEMKFPHLLHGAWKLVVTRPKIDDGGDFSFK